MRPGGATEYTLFLKCTHDGSFRALMTAVTDVLFNEAYVWLARDHFLRRYAGTIIHKCRSCSE
jgi:hypothetical protein